MAIKTYTKKQLQETPGLKVSEHFTLKDIYLETSFEKILIDTELLAFLDKVTAKYGKPGFNTNNSLYRTAKSNAAANGAPRSKHLQGIAADFFVRKEDGGYVEPVELARFAETAGMGGIGMYRGSVGAYKSSRHIHVDTRKGRTCWWILTTKSNTPGFGFNTVYKKGHRSPAIMDLQTALKSRGYKAGTVDGVFGANTDKAVRAFQYDNGLAVDGAVGKNTWARLGYR